MRTNVVVPAVLFVAISAATLIAAGPEANGPKDRPPVGREVGKDIVAAVGLKASDRVGDLINLAKDSGCTVYFQSADPAEVDAVRKAAEAAGLLGKSIFADQGDPASIHLADNLAGRAVLSSKVTVAEDEILRVLRPGGTAAEGAQGRVKPLPAGLDAWSHPYHGPDNNPQSRDQLARAPYLTQYVASPEFGCMPEVTVAAGGRVFRAFGHIAFREYQNAAINTLMAVDAYNGTILWTRPLRPGFMIHRNTMIATADTLYLADDESCKLLDAATGKATGEIVAPKEESDGPVWKWMALVDGVLYSLVGGEEVRPPVQRGRDSSIGGWPWGMWPGYEYKDPKTAWGFGRTFLAIEVKTKKVLWSHREEEYIDSRGTCMGSMDSMGSRGGKIYYYSPGKFLACLDAKTGKPAWKNSDADLLAAVGPDGRAQNPLVGFATSTYIKAHDKGLFFAGPQRPNLVVASAADGKVLWKAKGGNFQLVLRDDAIYAAGPQTGGQPTSLKLDYETGRELARFTDRRSCTRATGSIDSVFYRAKEGTVRLDPAAGVTEHISSMRPPCNSGVIVSEGLLHWGPWICGCRLSMFGDIALAPAGKFDFHPKYDDSRFQLGATAGDVGYVKPLEPAAGDWPCFRLDLSSSVAVPEKVKELWTYQPGQPTGNPGRATPAVAAGDFVFVGGEDGIVRAIGAADGKLRWQAYTGGAILSPPTIWRGRVFVGSADGWLYNFEATRGGLLWRYRVAPAERWIPVFGKIQSTWPVAGGAAVDGNGAVYAAAGMAHYDGTYVVALDGATGKLKWCNDSSGSLSKVHNGVSPHGPLYIEAGQPAALCFAGGNVYPLARFDTQTGKCLNAPVDSETSSAYDLFYNPNSIQGLMRVPLGDGRGVVANNANGKLTLVQKGGVLAAPGQGMPQGPQVGLLATYRAFVLANNVLLAGGQPGTRQPAATPGPRNPGAAEFALVAADFKDGKVIWSARLPACPVLNGIIATGSPARPGMVIVSLTDGRVVCFGADGN